MLIVGGVGDGWSFLASVEVYDPRTGRFTPVKPMGVARESLTATLMRDGRVLIAGGHRDRGENIVVYSSAEIYDPGGAGPAMTTHHGDYGGLGRANAAILAWCRAHVLQVDDPDGNELLFPLPSEQEQRRRSQNTLATHTPSRQVISTVGPFHEE